MNYQTFKPKELLAFLVDVINQKAKLKITQDALISHYKGSLRETIQKNNTKSVTLDEIEYENVMREALASFGYVNIDNSSNGLISHSTLKKYSFSDLSQTICSDFVNWLREVSKDEKICPDVFIMDSVEKYGPEAFPIAWDQVSTFINYYCALPGAGSKYASTAPILLSDLFDLEKENAEMGMFFDQRYIDFLNANFDEIDSIHWAKFEQLTQRYYEEKGYTVTPGVRRKDGGRDLSFIKGD